MPPQYEIPIICWKVVGGAAGSQGPQRAVRKDEELGEWKSLCPLHAAAVCRVLMGEHGNVFGRLYREAGQDRGVDAVLTKVDVQGRLLAGFSLVPKEAVHSTDSGQAAIFCHSLPSNGAQRVA